MKTKNNVQKAVLRAAAVIVSFVLISFTVSAQDFWKRVLTNSSFNEIAMAMVETSGKNESTDLSDSNSEMNYYMEEAEESLELESWMVNENNFDATAIFQETEIETFWDLEDWMMQEYLFESQLECDETVELEAWMLSEKGWAI